ncbi:tRNA-dihydrouridine synthase family protein [uncultured Draconibacterium sp.]|uniref:tRNA-dihydrouridine synthase family protein n=1 Tax=uncultured Draconibacterium sp. TaxID=1573823 RepID=UPI003217622B
MIYLAPLQGFTDFVYRKNFAQVFTGVDAYFIPYISIKNGDVPAKYNKEITPENNTQLRVVPQVLVEDGKELETLVARLTDLGYSEINLNMGCPYPMVTKRGKGSGLLPFPAKIEAILSSYFEKWNTPLSVKLRAGLQSENEIQQIIPILNKFPLKEVIFHPRIAQQLYSGSILETRFEMVQKDLQHELVFNGDIFTVSDYENRQKQFPEIKTWMLGRGILMNPFLPEEMKGIEITAETKREKLRDFHRLMFESYSEIMDNEGNALNKMQQFWSYFSFNFPNQPKAFKQIKKSKSMIKYKAEVEKLFYQLYE